MPSAQISPRRTRWVFCPRHCQPVSKVRLPPKSFSCRKWAWIAANGVRRSAQLYLRFACVLYATLAGSAAFSIAPDAVAPIATTLAIALLTLASFIGFRRELHPRFGTIVLVVACLAGIWSAATGILVLAVLPQILCLVAVLAVARREPAILRAPSLYLALGGAALLAATCSLLALDSRASVALLLFSAAGLLGIVYALARASRAFVDQRRDANGSDAIRRER